MSQMNLASLMVVVALLVGFWWGLKVGLFEAMVRLLGLVGASMLTMSSLRHLGGALASVLSDERLGFATAWGAAFGCGNVAFWFLGNLFLQRGKISYYAPLDRTFGVLASLSSVLLISSGIFIGIFLTPLGPAFMESTMPSGFVLCKADRRVPDLYAYVSRLLGAKEKPFRSDPFMDVVMGSDRSQRIDVHGQDVHGGDL